MEIPRTWEEAQAAGHRHAVHPEEEAGIRLQVAQREEAEARAWERDRRGGGA